MARFSIHIYWSLVAPHTCSLQLLLQHACYMSQLAAGRVKQSRGCAQAFVNLLVNFVLKYLNLSTKVLDVPCDLSLSIVVVAVELLLPMTRAMPTADRLWYCCYLLLLQQLSLLLLTTTTAVITATTYYYFSSYHCYYLLLLQQLSLLPLTTATKVTSATAL